MFVKRAWYAAGRSGELKARPLYRQLLGQDIALFRDRDGAPKAIGALCPHRGANLGLGRVVEGTLQCPFHGWQFDGEGRCVRIPSQTPSAAIAAKASVLAYALREQQGLLHIWMDPLTAPTHEPERYDFFEPAMARGRQSYDAMIYNASFLNTVENALDGAHLPFVHKGSLGGGQNPLQPDGTLSLDVDKQGFSSVSADTREGGETQSDAAQSSLADLALVVSSRLRFRFGGLVFYDLRFSDNAREITLAYITPRDAGTTWFFAETVRTRKLHALGDWLQRRYAELLLREDEAALGYILTPARGLGGLPQPVFVAADRPAVAFRRIYGDALKAEGHAAAPWALAEGPTAMNTAHLPVEAPSPCAVR